MEDGIAVLTDAFAGFEPARYNEDSVKTALENVRKYKKDFATEDAWLRQLRKLEQGVALFAANQNKS